MCVCEVAAESEQTSGITNRGQSLNATSKGTLSNLELYHGTKTHR